MRLALLLSILLAGCAAKKPAPRSAASPSATERKEADGDKADKNDKADKDDDDPGRDPMKGDPCEGGE